MAKDLGLVIVGGSIPERSGDKLYNTCCVFSSTGALLARHRKVVYCRARVGCRGADTGGWNAWLETRMRRVRQGSLERVERAKRDFFSI